MTLIKSISGIRGTIGKKEGDNLTPLDIVKFTTAFALFIQEKNRGKKVKIITGRDARISGDMVNHLVTGTLMGIGVDVVDLGLSTTPTVEVAVTDHQADGGIIITASHNPKHWNALKLVNNKGEFISGDDGEKVLELAGQGGWEYANVDKLGIYQTDHNAIERHIDKILALPLVNADAIAKANFTVAIDCVNSTGGLAIPKLLRRLGVKNIEEIFTEPNGRFPHNPEPLAENLSEISDLIDKKKVDVGFAVDPDVDRLAIVKEDGEMFGEEYTLVAVTDYILQHKKGNTVSNLSSTRALRDITEKAGGSYVASAVGEVNVVEKMKETQAVIGGEGNGGVIYPDLHYGRDALVGIALILSYMAISGKSISRLRKTYPDYAISKNKIQLSPEIKLDLILKTMAEKYKRHPQNTIDGLKIEFENSWVHLRKSNTEPIIRIYSEAENQHSAEVLGEKIMSDIREIIRGE
ncbi:MAG: phosphoglucosamine mutase [Bacteroidales bacterium]|nr:phosphoglucosamine mutase [Bacteroidales bacterium]